MAKSLILTEGVADDCFLEALIAVRRIPNVEVAIPGSLETRGDGGFGRRLGGLKLKEVENHPSLVIIADNDDSPQESFRAIQAQVRDAGYNAPDAPYQLSVRGEFPPVAIAMLPSEGMRGSLDTMCMASANTAKYGTQLNCVDAFAGCLPAAEATWGVTKFGKLRVRCLLSGICRGDPYVPLKFAWKNIPGKNLEGDIFPLDHTVFDTLANFLFGLPV